MFSADPEVLQNCAGFTLCSSAGLAVRDCSALMGLTPCILCVQITVCCCIGLLSVEFLTVNTGLGRPMFWKPLRLLSTVLMRVWLPQTINLHKLLTFSTQKYHIQ